MKLTKGKTLIELSHEMQIRAFTAAGWKKVKEGEDMPLTELSREQSIQKRKEAVLSPPSKPQKKDTKTKKDVVKAEDCNG